jgi:hypothetical protein
VPLFRAGLSVADVRKRAAAWQATEAVHLDILRKAQTKARVRVWTLSEFLEAPGEVLRIVQEDLGGRVGRPVLAAPCMVDLAGLSEFLQGLRNEGMLPHLVGDLSRISGQPVRSTATRRAN